MDPLGTRLKTYPHIDKRVFGKAAPFGGTVFVQPKPDGSNLRVEFSRKGYRRDGLGLSKWGRRTGLLDDSNPILHRGVDLFLEKYSEGFVRTCVDERWEKATAFFEFHGPSSFAGNHSEDEDQTVDLFDVQVSRKGFLSPHDFYKLFGDLPVIECIHHGLFGPEEVDQVWKGCFPGQSFEGVIVKKGFDRKRGGPLMYKVKSQAWLARLKTYCGENEDLYRRLS